MSGKKEAESSSRSLPPREYNNLRIKVFPRRLTNNMPIFNNWLISQKRVHFFVFFFFVFFHLCFHLTYHSIKLELEKLAQEKSEMQRHYVMVSTTNALQLSIELYWMKAAESYIHTFFEYIKSCSKAQCIINIELQKRTKERQNILLSQLSTDKVMNDSSLLSNWL